MIIKWVPKSHKVLMLICLLKDAKQSCNVTLLDCTHCYDHLLTMSTIEWCEPQHCFGDGHQNLFRLICPIVIQLGCLFVTCTVQCGVSV